MSDLPEYVIERSFSAPRELVWRAWTDPELLSRWYGPNVETIIHRFDLEPEGQWLNEMKWGENSNYQKVIFKEVLAPEKMVWHHHSCTDGDWNDMANPMMPDWPHLLLTTVTFTSDGETTKVRLSQIPLDCSEAEIACFADAMANMDKGWGSGFEILQSLLQELAA